MQGTGISTDESSGGKCNTRQEVQHSTGQRIKKKKKGEKKQTVRHLQKGEIRHFLPMLTTLSYVLSLILGRRQLGSSLRGWHSAAPSGCTGEHTQEGQSYAGRAEPS